MKPLPPSFLSKAAATAAVAAFLAFPSFQARAVVIAADSFSVNGTRTAGSSVSGTLTETGNLSWSGGSQWVLFGDETNGYMGTKGSGSAGIGIPFNFATYQSSGEIATLSASIAYRKDSNTGRWFALGFGSNTTVGGLPSAVYLQVNVYTGTWELMSAANSGGDLPSGTITGINFASSTPVTYSLTYDNSRATVLDISINGTSVLSNYTFASAPAEIQSAGFWGQLPYNTQTGVVFDNLELTVVPEPGTSALFIGGAAVACLGVAFRRKRKSAAAPRGSQDARLSA